MAAVTKKDGLPNAEARSIAERIEALKLSWRLELEYPLETLARQLRVQVRDEENNAPQSQVDEYAEAARNGAVFPPLVASADDRTIDGNTRLRALLLVGRTTAPVFVLAERFDGPDSEHQQHLQASMRMLGVKLNTHGKPASGQERRKAVIQALRNGYRPLEVMQVLHVSRDYVRNIEDEVKAVQRCEEVGIASPETKLGAMQLRALANSGAGLYKDLFHDVAELAIDANLPATKIAEVSSHVSDPNKVADYNEARLFVAEERKTLEPDIEARRKLREMGKKTKSYPAANISRACGVFAKYKDDPQSTVEPSRLKKHAYLTSLREAYAALGSYIQAQEDDIRQTEQVA